ncbi:hypothetical protein L596_010181 [Steinernema carpocapsae]|uniref:Uncharacterized protein n=1 Tax=Steinernema carpocapsae TaxID=34508 RepID=A0A4U5PHT0_STECR|nr:hypothetical protein L596_010181 [Steinernema carpocapsae]
MGLRTSFSLTNILAGLCKAAWNGLEEVSLAVYLDPMKTFSERATFPPSSITPDIIISSTAFFSSLGLSKVLGPTTSTSHPLFSRK